MNLDKRLLVSVNDAATMLSVSRDTVYRLIASQELPTIDMGIGRSKTRVRVSHLETLIERRAAQSGKVTPDSGVTERRCDV